MAKSAKVRAPSLVSADEKRWRAEADLNTLMEAERIEKDPARLKAARAIAKERMKAIQDVMGEKE